MKDQLANSARAWGVSEGWARCLFWIPIVGATVLPVIRLASKDLYYFLVIEDGPVEQLQFACFAAAGVFGLVAARAQWVARSRGYAALFGLFGLAMLFIAGEEISWGQRILGLETPAELSEINKQDEITVHNVFGVLGLFNFAMMVGAAWGAAAWLANRKLRLERFSSQAERVFVPPVFLVPAFGFVFLYRLIRFTVIPHGGATIATYGEWGEFCLAMALCAYAWLHYRRTFDTGEAAHGALSRCRKENEVALRRERAVRVNE